MYRFPERLRAARRKQKLTQAQAAELIEIHPKTLGRWERGQDSPSFHTGCRIAKELKVNAFYLAGLVESPIPGTQLDNGEGELIKNYRALGAAEKALWLESLRDAIRARNITKARC